MRWGEVCAVGTRAKLSKGPSDVGFSLASDPAFFNREVNLWVRSFHCTTFRPKSSIFYAIDGVFLAPIAPVDKRS